MKTSSKQLNIYKLMDIPNDRGKSKKNLASKKNTNPRKCVTPNDVKD